MAECGPCFTLPKFDIGARDFLSYAENELLDRRNGWIINFISHLKRAIDYQVNMFLHVYGLESIFKRASLGRKMDFLERAGIFPARTLKKLNVIRNKMEHEYEIPKIEELEAYLDLVIGFIAILEGTILLKMRSNLELTIEDTEKEEYIGWFRIEYIHEFPSKNLRHIYPQLDRIPAMRAELHLDSEDVIIVVDTSTMAEFEYFFKVFILLCQIEAFSSVQYIRSQLIGLSTD